MAVPFAWHVSGSTIPASGLLEGDVAEAHSGDDLYRYTVSRVLTVPSTEENLPRATAGSTVTLMACGKELRDRLVVIGVLTDVVRGAADA